MKVTLFRDMKAEGWCSMDRYADSLSRHLSIVNCQLSIVSIEPPVNSSKVRMFWRNEVYPRIARFNQGEVNHILDHSYAHLLKYLDPSKTVITCHDLTPLEFEKDPVLREAFRKVVENLRLAAVVIADSQETKRDIVKYLSIPSEKIEVVYLGVDSAFRPIDSIEERVRIRKKYNLPEGKIIFSHGQAHLPYKNTEGIIRAFAEVLESRSDVFLLRVNSLTPEQKELLGSLAVGDHYLEIVNPTDEELVELYNAADVFLSPSFKEGFGLPVLQALACGVPVVISPGGSLEEIAGDFGVYADPQSVSDITQKVLSVLGGDSEIAHHQLERIARAKGFSWRGTARKTLDVYQKIFREPRIHPAT